MGSDIQLLHVTKEGTVTGVKVKVQPLKWVLILNQQFKSPESCAWVEHKKGQRLQLATAGRRYTCFPRGTACRSKNDGIGPVIRKMIFFVKNLDVLQASLRSVYRLQTPLRVSNDTISLLVNKCLTTYRRLNRRIDAQLDRAAAYDNDKSWSEAILRTIVRKIGNLMLARLFSWSLRFGTEHSTNDRCRTIAKPELLGSNNESATLDETIAL